MRRNASYKFLLVLYTALAIVMYYHGENYFAYGSVWIRYRYIYAIVIIMISLVVMLVTADLNRIVRLGRYVALLCTPHLLTILISVPLWVIHFDPMETIRRGIINESYAVIIYIAMAGMLYALGNDAVWVNLVALVIPNILVLLEAIRNSSFSTYLQELWVAVKTFAGTVGPVISQMEVHEPTFVFGVYLIFLLSDLQQLRQKPAMMWAMLISMFFFLSGFKRIGIFALALALLAYWLLRTYSGTGEKRRSMIYTACIALFAAMFLYVAMVSSGLLTYLQDEMGIDLMGRENILADIRSYFFFGPNYLGYGTGFILELVNEIRGTGLHNDILATYVDLGFWGFLIWMGYYLIVRVRMIVRWQGAIGGILAFSYSLYLCANSLTDNTMNYTLVTGTIALLIMAYGSNNATETEVAREKKLTELPNLEEI